jgi:hypothetical protein
MENMAIKLENATKPLRIYTISRARKSRKLLTQYMVRKMKATCQRSEHTCLKWQQLK